MFQNSDCTCTLWELKQSRKKSVHLHRFQQAGAGIDGWPSADCPLLKLEQLSSVQRIGRNVAVKPSEDQLDRFKPSNIKDWITLLHAQARAWLCPPMEHPRSDRKIRGVVSMKWHPTRAGIIFGLFVVQSWWKHFSPQRWFGIFLWFIESDDPREPGINKTIDRSRYF